MGGPKATCGTNPEYDKCIYCQTDGVSLIMPDKVNSLSLKIVHPNFMWLQVYPGIQCLLPKI
jgi:hypothetical protein